MQSDILTCATPDLKRIHLGYPLGELAGPPPELAVAASGTGRVAQGGLTRALATAISAGRDPANNPQLDCSCVLNNIASQTSLCIQLYKALRLPAPALQVTETLPGWKTCWYIAVDTLSTLGSLFSSIPPYRVARDSGT